MRYLKQFGIILFISFLGEILHQLIPLPIPASIYGLVIILGCLISGFMKLEDVKEAASFLLEIMPVLFIPAAVGLIDSWGVLRPLVIPISVMTIISTIIVMAVAGRVTQRIIRHHKKKSGNEA